eukprot:TRINITY_DN27724_c0_g1_i1.p1 TRINITY_DN27724_c0_g1~~TRINITY_DN27724_c0_g1_i1.p1  ORF type:complete len:106 (-),score=20.33 TRINITY_DN27724_c0_g1_i1:79-360(-)
MASCPLPPMLTALQDDAGIDGVPVVAAPTLGDCVDTDADSFEGDRGSLDGEPLGDSDYEALDGLPVDEDEWSLLLHRGRGPEPGAKRIRTHEV